MTNTLLNISRRDTYKSILAHGLIELSPNPFTEETFVSLPEGTAGPITISITSQKGESVHSFSTDASKSRINIGTELKSGFYFMNLNGSFGHKAFKLVKL